MSECEWLWFDSEYWFRGYQWFNARWVGCRGVISEGLLNHSINIGYRDEHIIGLYICDCVNWKWQHCGVNHLPVCTIPQVLCKKSSACNFCLTILFTSAIGRAFLILSEWRRSTRLPPSISVTMQIWSPCSLFSGNIPSIWRQWVGPACLGLFSLMHSSISVSWTNLWKIL